VVVSCAKEIAMNVISTSPIAQPLHLRGHAKPEAPDCERTGKFRSAQAAWLDVWALFKMPPVPFILKAGFISKYRHRSAGGAP
jgi:hypothetical protein